MTHLLPDALLVIEPGERCHEWRLRRRGRLLAFSVAADAIDAFDAAMRELEVQRSLGFDADLRGRLRLNHQGELTTDVEYPGGITLEAQQC